MSLTEQTRLRLHQYIEERMGAELAREIMEWLPRGELATKADIEAARLATTAEFEGLRAAVKADTQDVRSDVRQLQETLILRMESMTDKVRTDFHRDLRTHTLVLVGTVVTLNAIMASAARVF